MADIIGDDKPNALTGTEDANLLWGMGGIDQLHGLGGDDTYLLTDAFALVVVQASWKAGRPLSSQEVRRACH